MKGSSFSIGPFALPLFAVVAAIIDVSASSLWVNAFTQPPAARASAATRHFNFGTTRIGARLDSAGGNGDGGVEFVTGDDLHRLRQRVLTMRAELQEARQIGRAHV